MRKRRSIKKARRKGFAFGLFSGVLFVAYRELKNPGTINRRDLPLCVAVVLAFALVGGLIGLALGAMSGSADRDD